MKGLYWVIGTILVLFCSRSVSQKSVSSLANNYFGSPVNYKFRLAGNFGELRETHFHAGIDIKPSSGKKVEKVNSIGDGYISRIYVSPGGYGRAVYIDHPEVGYTSVYGHLEKFSDGIEKLVREHQLAAESFEVDFCIEPNVFALKKGQEIGVMGNSGYSHGKHLHLEIRDTKTENPVNPLLFGLDIDDNSPPVLMALALNGLDPEFHKISEEIIPLMNTDSSVTNFIIPYLIPAWRLGIAVQLYDKMDGAYNKNGIYSLRMYVDDSLTYSFHMNKISFEQTKNIIGFYDYEVKKTKNKTFTLCYKYPGNQLEFLEKNGTGLINIYVNKERKIRIDVEDFRKNRKSVQFLVKRSEDLPLQPTLKEYRQRIKVGEAVLVTENNCSVHFENNSLFRNIRFNMATIVNPNNQPVYEIHNENEPIKKPIFISIKPETVIAGMDKKMVIVRHRQKSGKVNYGGVWQNERLTTRIREFGHFSLAYDSIPPTIKPIDFRSKAGRKSKFTFIVKDNMITRGDFCEEIRYKVWIDDQFTISPFRMMNNRLDIPLGHLVAGSHLLKIEAKDHSGNTSYFTATFTK